jgi:transposase
VIADKAFDAEERVIHPLGPAGKTAVIPPESHRRNPRPHDGELYKARHPIENFFAKLEQFRAVATRYDKRAKHFLAAIHLAASVIRLNRGRALRGSFQNSRARRPATRKRHAAWSSDWMMKPSRS